MKFNFINKQNNLLKNNKLYIFEIIKCFTMKIKLLKSENE